MINVTNFRNFYDVDSVIEHIKIAIEMSSFKNRNYCLCLEPLNDIMLLCKLQ